MAASYPGSQHLLVTLLGSYLYGQNEPIPSAFLVRLLHEFGVTEVGARNGLSRVAKRGLLEISRPGRHTFYRLTDEAHAHHAEGLSQILAFGSQDDPWDGTWTLVMFSVAERDRAQRHLVRQLLGALRFGMLFDGVWVRPGQPPEQTVAALKSLELQKATVITGATVTEAFGPGDPVQAFGLDEVRSRYDEFLRSLTPLLARMEAGEIGAAEALLRRTEVMDQWRYFPERDPLLPQELLPDSWPLPAAREAFRTIYDGLGELAVLRVRNLLSEYAPELSNRVRTLTSGDLRDRTAPAQSREPVVDTD